MSLPARKPPTPVAVYAAPSGILDLTDKQRDVMFKRALFLKPVHHLMDIGVKRRTACKRVLGQLKRGELPPDYVALAKSVGRKGNAFPSEGTMMRWLSDAESGDQTRLAPKQTGRRHVAEGWEAAAEREYSRMQKPSMYTVFENLQADFPDISYNKVNRYLNSLPATRGRDGAARVGKHFHALNKRDYVERDLSNLQPGEIWQGDGHRVDTYLAHPVTGRPWRPELTAWIDVVSRYIVGWYLSENESTTTTNFALCHALESCEHQPLIVHVDNGSGFASRAMAAPNVGLYDQLGIEPMFAIPGNPKAKGHIERWFRTFEEKFGKRWDTYCGVDMAPEANRRLTVEVKSGKRELPSLYQYVEGVREFVEWYNHRPHRGLAGRTPASVWAERTPNPIADISAVNLRERAECKVIRLRVRLHNRWYKSPELVDFEGRQVITEYWLHDDARVRVLDLQGRFICEAGLVKKSPYLPDSRLEERRQKNLEQQRRRAQEKLDDVSARARLVLPHEEQLARLEKHSALSVDDADALEHSPGIRLNLTPDFEEMAEPAGPRLDLSLAVDDGAFDDEEYI